VNRLSDLFNRSWSDNKDNGARKSNYVPLAEREWDGKVQVMETRFRPITNRLIKDTLTGEVGEPFSVSVDDFK